MKRHDLLRLARVAVQLARTQLRDDASKFARSAIRNRRCWPVCA